MEAEYFETAPKHLLGAGHLSNMQRAIITTACKAAHGRLGRQSQPVSCTRNSQEHACAGKQLHLEDVHAAHAAADLLFLLCCMPPRLSRHAGAQ